MMHIVAFIIQRNKTISAIVPIPCTRTSTQQIKAIYSKFRLQTSVCENGVLQEKESKELTFCNSYVL